MTIATPTVLTFYADSKYVKFFQFVVSHLKPKIWENLPELWKKGNSSKKVTNLIESPFIRQVISDNPTIEVSSSNLQNVEFRKMWKHCRWMFICFVFIPRGDCIKPKVQDNWEGAHSKVNVKLFFKLTYILGQGESLVFCHFRATNYDFIQKRTNLQSI